MKKTKITNVDEAIEFLGKKAGINVEEVTHKWRIWDNDFDSSCKDDKELIEYAKEQQEAIEVD